jgi:Skp family chaperone for outer membrane proteins
MKPLRNPVALTVALLLFAAFLAGNAASQATYEPVRVAFVDVAVLFQNYGKAATIQQEVRARIGQIDDGLRKRFEELKKDRADLDLLVPDTQEFNEAKMRVDEAEWRLGYDEKRLKRGVHDEFIQRMSLVYKEIRSECDNYARRNGLNAVLMVNETDIAARTQEELMAVIASRPVLYHDKALDITKQILEVLNK